MKIKRETNYISKSIVAKLKNHGIPKEILSTLKLSQFRDKENRTTILGYIFHNDAFLRRVADRKVKILVESCTNRNVSADTEKYSSST